MPEQIKIQTFNWGPCVTKFKIKPEYAKQLLDEAKKNKEDFRGKAAGLYIEQKIIRTGKLEDLTSEELESRMKTIIDEYSPILEGVDETELKKQVLSKPKSQKDSS